MDQTSLQPLEENQGIIEVDTDEMMKYIQKQFEEKTGRTVSITDIATFIDAENDFLREKGIIFDYETEAK